MRIGLLALIFSLGLSGVLWGKRPPPKFVAPITSAGITYSAAGDGRTAYIIATDNSTKEELWWKKIFVTHIKFWIEEDTQWVFINDLKLAPNALLIRDEKSRCYLLNLTNRRVRKESCAKDFSTP
jgi:hypothetical protein